MPNENDSNRPTADPQDQPLPQSPVVPPAPHESELGINPNRRSTDKQEGTVQKLEEDIRKGEHWLIRIGAAGVIMNVIIALIYYGQLHEMRKATSASAKAADAAMSAAATADTTLKNSQKSFELDQRPYLVAEGVTFVSDVAGSQPSQPVAGVPVRANITFRNIGRAPADKWIANVTLVPFSAGPGPASQRDFKKFAAFMESTFVNLREKNKVGRKEMTEASAEQDTAPGGTFFVMNQNSVLLSAPELPRIKTGDFILVDVGIVSYGDSFNNGYETEFCYFYAGDEPKTWHICPSHNVIR